MISPLLCFHLTVCAVFQNEGLFLKEWIEFHKIVGVEHFYLYNNRSSDNYLEILQPYIDSGEVDLIDWPVETHNEKDYLNLLQLPVYNHALDIAKNTSRWIAFIDLDEFLFPVKHTNLIDMLEEYNDCAGLAVNWLIYGTSKLDTIPENHFIIESLIYRAPTEYQRNMIIKMIVQPRYVKAINNPHYFDYHEGYFAVDSLRNRLPSGSCMQPVVTDVVRINHYWTGPYNWLITEKLPRREKWGLIFPMDYLEILLETLNEKKDDSILRFLPTLKEKMKQ